MDSGQQKSRPILAILIFVAAIGAIAFVFATFPPFTAEQKQRLRLPSNIEDVKIIGEIMAEYKDKYYFTVLLGFSLVYLFLQTFTIPGTIFLNFLAGALFGIYVTVPLCCFLAATGASGAFMMSHLIGRRIVMKFAPDRLRYFNEQIQKHRHNLFNYFLFLRISPLLPNWFVNLASPICSVPFKTFWIGTFFGVMPQTFIVVRAGLTLQDIKSPSDVLDIRAFITLALLAFLALIPTLKPVQNVLDRLLTRTDNKNKLH